MERLHAFFLLGLCLLKSILAPLLPLVFGARRGLADFERSYAPDRLPPLTPSERHMLPLLSGCIACGLCDLGEGVRARHSSGAYNGPMDLMLTGARSMPDFDASVRSFAAVSDERLAELELRCPARVPMREVAAFVRAKAAPLPSPARRAAG